MLPTANLPTDSSFDDKIDTRGRTSSPGRSIAPY